MPARKKLHEAPRGSIIAVLLLSLLINAIMLNKDAFIYKYYSSTVFSMAQSFNNFIYASYDPAGFLTVRQMPLALMLQTIFVKFFGFYNASQCLPQVIAAVLSCFVLYRILIKSIVDEVMGGWAALFGALLLAVTPVFAALARSNMPDMVMILFILLSAQAMLNAATKRSVGRMLLSALLLGLAFNTKINQGLIAAPGILLVSFLVPKTRATIKFVWASVFSVIFAVVSIGWLVLVDTTPTDYRPYVGGTNTNSAFEMVLSKYNNGVLGMGDKDDGLYESYAARPQNTGGRIDLFGSLSAVNRFFTRQDDGPGIWRLLSDRWHPQGSWMLAFAILSLIAALVYTFSCGDDLYGRAVVLFSTWFILAFLVLSFTARDLGTYYSVMVAVPAAALSALGAYAMVQFYREHGYLWILLPLAALIAAIEQASAIISGAWALWLVFFPVLCLLLAILLFAARLIPRKDKRYFRNCAICAMIACAVLLVTSFAWSLTPLIYGADAELPQAGPQLMDAEPGQIPAGLKDYLKQNFAGSAIMLIVPSAVEYGSQIITKTGWKVVAAGGYDGRDRYISLEDLQQMAQSKQVRYMLVSGNEPYQEFTDWVLTRRLVPYDLWYTGNEPQNMLPKLYDLWVPGAVPGQEDDTD